MKKTLLKVVSRKLVIRHESVAVLRTAQLAAVGGGYLAPAPQEPHSILDHCVSAVGGGCAAR
ncbi:MAG TPA: hypothetical protein VFP84_03460 [Kofleriaceae bacterium]|nr:hypothetical protein [Kofleriaceae bacterium]